MYNNIIQFFFKCFFKNFSDFVLLLKFIATEIYAIIG